VARKRAELAAQARGKPAHPAVVINAVVADRKKTKKNL